jgi:hypothetical protein
MRVKNTAPGGRGFGVSGVPYEIAAGATAEIPDAVVKEARLDKSVDGMFSDGTFVIESGKPAAKADDEGESVKVETKGKAAK